MKSILIVGSGPGISLSVAYRFAREGFHVVFMSRNEQSLKSLCKKLTDTGFKASYRVGDVADFEATQKAIEEINKENPIDVLLYNAAAIKQKSIEELSAEDLMYDFKVNVVGAFNVAKALTLLTGDRMVTLLFTGGGLALKPYFKYTSLSIGKAGLRSFVFSLAQEYKDSRFKIGTVTIAGFVKKGTHFDPDRIANEFWQLYADPAKRYEIEIIYE